MTELQTLHLRFCEYCEVFKGNSPKTIIWLKGDFKSFLKQSGVTHMEEVNRHVIENWLLHGKLERKWSNKTIRLRLQSMSLFLEWCINENLIEENYVSKIPKPKLPNRIPKHLNQDQVSKLFDWVRNYPYEYQFERKRATGIIYTFVFTGLRKTELQNLKMEDVDLETKMLFVRSGKGAKDRIVPIHPRLHEILTDYVKDRKRLRKTCPYFFTALKQDTMMGDKVVKRLFIKLRKKIGFELYPHLLRHTFATLMLEGGCNLYALSKMLGHSDIKTTTIYLGATRAHLTDQITKHPMQFH